MYQISSNEMLNTLISNIEQTVAIAKEKISNFCEYYNNRNHTGRLGNILLKQSRMEKIKQHMVKITHNTIA